MANGYFVILRTGMNIVQLELFRLWRVAAFMMMHTKVMITIATISNKTFAHFFAISEFLS
jgi:hypothetical protein